MEVNSAVCMRVLLLKVKRARARKCKAANPTRAPKIFVVSWIIDQHAHGKESERNEDRDGGEEHMHAASNRCQIKLGI